MFDNTARVIPLGIVDSVVGVGGGGRGLWYYHSMYVGVRLLAGLCDHIVQGPVGVGIPHDAGLGLSLSVLSVFLMSVIVDVGGCKQGW